MMSSQILVPGWLQHLLVVLLRLALSSAFPLRTSNVTTCSARGPASYILVFTGHWSPQTFPKQYPLFRPPAQWSKLVGKTCLKRCYSENSEKGELSLEGVKGTSGTPEAQLRRTRAFACVFMCVSDRSAFSIPQLSLLVKVIPSPDWFVGVDSLNLCEGGQWKQEVTFDLHPFDAGTDSGFTFSSPNFPTMPPENITMITSQKPNHPANSFYYPRLPQLPPLATIWLRRQARSPVRQHNHVSNHILPHHTKPQKFSGENSLIYKTPLDCEVSMWSSWGLCLGPCSRGGLRHRTRYIMLKPANSGSPCPELEEQAECTPHNCLAQ
uniref:Spondin 2a, extracellular matrix protein n=1 Tax=Astyanax mexicanus TaxID=7994 RepID=A0A8B9RC50_ASTMX